MAEDLGKRIRIARDSLKLSQTDLAKLVEVTREAVSQWESGDTEPKTKNLRKLAAELDVNYPWLAEEKGPMRGDPSRLRLGLPLYGQVEAGVFTEVHESQDWDVERVPVAPDERWPAEAQYALRVRGNSIDRIAPNGSIIHCVDIHEAGIEIRDGDIVCVERQKGDLIETTVKEVRKIKNAIELRPVSNDPAHLKSIKLEEMEGITVRIRGLVIALLTPIPRGG